MKNSKNISLLILALISLGLGSCQKETSPSDLTLTVSQDRSIGHLGDTIPLTIKASTSKDKITSITITKTGGKSVTIPAISSKTNYSQVINYIVNDSVGTLVFTISANAANLTSPIVKTLTFSIVKDVEITLGASSSLLPSFINGSTLKTYNASEAAASQASIDLLYKYTTSDGAVIGSPSDPTFSLTSWTTKNVTKIAKIMDETPDAVSMVTGTSVKNLTKGDMLGYITSGGVNGIIEVMDITVGVNGNCTFTFMVIK